MRAFLAAFTLVASTVLVAGCLGGDGTFRLHATDAPDNIGDFSSLPVGVSSIVLTTHDGKTSSYTPAKSTFDLVTLQNANATELFKGSVAAGNYTELELKIADANGVLKAGGGTVAVKVPSGRFFVNVPFTIASGKETNFVFDVQVHKEGNGQYLFKPNAGGSGPRSSAPEK